MKFKLILFFFIITVNLFATDIFNVEMNENGDYYLLELNDAFRTNSDLEPLFYLLDLAVARNEIPFILTMEWIDDKNLNVYTLYNNQDEVIAKLEVTAKKANPQVIEYFDLE